MEQQIREKLVLQWHPAFFAGLRIEFREEQDKMFFENEHQLGTKPKEIDVLIIKKNSNDPIKKNLGRIFRKHNLVEYKSPTDYLSVDDFYKVYGYACFYKSDVEKIDSIDVNEITISFVCKKYPREVIKHLRDKRNFEISQQEKGIYYIIGDIFPIQIIVTSRLSEEYNFWLRNLTDDIRDIQTIRKLTEEYQKNRGNNVYRSVMNIIIRANRERFQEEKGMCEAIIELFQDEYDAGIKAAKIQQLVELVQDKLLSLEEAVKRSGISKEEFLQQLECVTE